MHDDAKVQRLAAIPLFAHLDRRHLRRIAALSTDVIVEPGRVLCREGEPGLDFFVVEDGRFTVTVKGREISTLGPGDFFGELALLDGGHRTAGVAAATAGRVLVVGQGEFEALLREEPVVAVRMLPGIGARMRRLADAASHPVGV
jgi:CRP-like cAMP-binding protein